MATRKLSKCNDLPVVRRPDYGSGDCIGVDGSPLKAGQTSDWSLPAYFPADNPEQDYWQDEESELFVTAEDGELIVLE